MPAGLELLEAATDAGGFGLGAAELEQEAGEDADDGDHGKQLEQGEGTAYSAIL